MSDLPPEQPVNAGLGELPPDRLLPGERLLWSARPGRVPVPGRRVARLLMSLVLDTAFVALMLAVLAQLRHQDAFARREGPTFWLVMAVVLAALVLPTLGDLVRLTLLRPAQLRQSVYEVSNLRVLVTSGRRPRCTRSAYLDQIEDYPVTRRADGTADLHLAGVDMCGVREPDQLMRVIADARPRMLDHAANFAWPAGAVEPPGLILDPGERVLWTGRPRSVPWWFGRTDIVYSLRSVCGVVAFGLLAGVVFAGVAAADSGFAALALACLYLAAGRVIVRRQRIRRSRYVLTDRRLVVISPARGRSIAQAPLIKLRPPTIWGQSLLIGTVPARPPSVHYWNGLTSPAATSTAPSLVGIDDSVGVRDLICAAQLAQRASKVASKSGHAQG